METIHLRRVSDAKRTIAPRTIATSHSSMLAGSPMEPERIGMPAFRRPSRR